jgi:hypothetical protein
MAFPSLKSAIGAIPVQKFANCVSQLKPTEALAGLYHFLYHQYLLDSELPIAKSLLLYYCCHGIVLS